MNTDRDLASYAASLRGRSPRASSTMESSARGQGSPRLGEQSMQMLMSRMDDLERRTRKFENFGDRLIKERNSRVAVEEDIDIHFERLEEHEGRIDQEIKRLEGEIDSRVRALHSSLVGEDSMVELEDFRAHAVAPLEELLRNSIQNELAPLKRHLERYEKEKRNFEEEIRHTDGERFARIEKVLEDNYDLFDRKTADLSTQQSDHHEAIDNMMDMLEKTVTHDDLAKVIDQHSNETMRSLQDAFDHSEELSGKLSTLDERVKIVEMERETFLVTRDMLTETEKHLLDALDAQAQQLSEDSVQLQAKLAHDADGMTDEIAKLAGRCNENQDECHNLTQRLSYFDEAFPKHADDIQRLSTTCSAIEAKLDSTAQVLDQKVELTADEMDRQLAATMASIDTKLSKLQREINDHVEATEKATLNETRVIRSGLDQQMGKLSQKVEIHEGLLSSRSTEDIRELREQLKSETSGLRSTIDTRLHEVSQKVDKKLENSLKQVREFTVSFKEEVTTVQESVAHVTTEMHSRTAEIVVDVKKVERDVLGHDKRFVELSKLENQIQEINGRIDLEKDRTNSTVKRLEAKFTGDGEKLERRVIDQVDKISDRLDAQIRDSISKNSVQDATIADHHAHFTSLCLQIEQRAGDKDADVRREILGLGNGVETKIQNLSASLASFETKLGDTTRHQESQLESARAYFGDVCSKLDNKISDQSQKSYGMVQDRIAKTEEQVSNTRTQFDDKMSNLQKLFAKRDSDFEEKMRTKFSSQDAKIDNLAASGQAYDNKIARMDAAVAQVTATVRDNREYFGKTCTNMEKRFEDRATTLDAAATEARDLIGQHYGHFQQLCADLENEQKGIQTDGSQTVRDLEACRGHFTEIYQKLDTEQKGDHRKFTEVYTQLQAKSNEMRSDIDAKLLSQQQHFVDITGNLDKKFMEKHGLAEARMKDQHQLIQDTLAMVEIQSKEKDAEHDKRFSEIVALVIQKAQESAELSRKVERQSTERDNRYVEKFQEATNSVRDTKREMLSANSALQKQLAETARSLTDDFSEKAEALARASTRLERKVEKVDSTCSDRCTAMQASIDSNHEHAMGTSARNFTQHTERLDTFDQRIQKESQDLQHAQATSTKEIADSLRRLSTSTKEETEGLRADLTALASTVGANEHNGSAAVTNVEDKLTDMTKALEDRITKQREILSGAISRVDTSHAEKSSAQSDAILAQRDILTKLINDLDLKLRTLTNGLDEKTVELAQTVNEHHGHFTQVAERLVELVKQENEGQDARVAQAFGTIEGAIATLDGHLREGGEHRDNRLDELDAALGGLDVRLAEKNTAQDERADSLSQGLDSLRAATDASTAAIEARAASFGAATTARIDSVEQKFADALAQELGLLKAETGVKVETLAGELAAEATSRASEDQKLFTAKLEARAEREILDGRLTRTDAKLEATGVELKSTEERLEAALAARAAELKGALEVGEAQAVRLAQDLEKQRVTADGRVTALEKDVATKLAEADATLTRKLGDVDMNLAGVKHEQGEKDMSFKATFQEIIPRIEHAEHEIELLADIKHKAAEMDVDSFLEAAVAPHA
eukprot:SAG11_NODE_656_length_7905_cov_4.191007_3_plen_1578_part_00